MAPLSRALVGLILDYAHFGSHLNSSKKTIDENLERRNFDWAQKKLAEVFSQVTVDGIKVVSEAIAPEKPATKATKFGGALKKKDREFLHKHSQESSLAFQLFKCNDRRCCKKLRSNYKQYFQSGRIPVPVLFKKTSSGEIKAVNPDEKETKSMKWGNIFLNTRFV